MTVRAPKPSSKPPIHPDSRATGNQTIYKVSHIHECIINEMIADPTKSIAELAEIFGYSKSWMSRLTNSDSFQARLAERRQEVMDPSIRARLKDKLETVTMVALDSIQRKLESPEASADLALSSLGVIQQSLGIIAPPKK